ncbi:hypothetical protein DENSPDRAFT_755192, partial [Dentipellis sp. KUC8613]
EWLKDTNRRIQFQTSYDGGVASIKDFTYDVIVDFVRITHNTESEAERRVIESRTGLPTDAIALTRWLKPTARRKPNQRVAHLLVKLRSAADANHVLRHGISIQGMDLRTRKNKREPKRCLKCQKIGSHFAKECPENKDICGTCGKTHVTKACEEDDKTHFWCVNCEKHGHASWDRTCATFMRRSEEMDKRTAEATYRYYPTNEPWTWEQ